MIADPGLADPTRNLRDFPQDEMAAGDLLFRAASVGNGPWWFSSDGSSRFDLCLPLGTSYTAQNMETAVRERSRRGLISCGVVDPAFVAEMEICWLELPRTVINAELNAGTAPQFGASRKLCTHANYELTRRLAVAFHSAGHGGIHYGSRFTTVPANWLAIFGDAGERTNWPVSQRMAGRAAMETEGLGPDC